MSQTRRATDLSPEEKQLIYQFLNTNSTKGKPQNGKIAQVAASYGVCRRTIQNVWATATKAIQLSVSVPEMFKSKRMGVKKVQLQPLDTEMMRAIPFEKRGTIRRLAVELNVSKSKVGRWVKSGEIKAHTNAVKPILTELNKVQRIKYCLKAIQVDPITHLLKFDSMHNVVHIDEKWFYMSENMRRGYKLPDETDPYRTCKNKRFIPKLMFMCAVARPHYANDGSLIWDGKIGIFPFTQEVPAQRNSRNRARGTLVTKPIKSINKEVIKECLINQIVPAIKANWPANASKNIFIQQDNARPHLHNNDPEFMAVATSDGFNIQLIFQPPNSPDTNINDLGWFRAIQSLQIQTKSYNFPSLVQNVGISYQDLTHIKLNKVFLSLQQSMIEMLKVDGGNDYKLAHMQKDSLILEGALPETLEIEDTLVRQSIDYLVDKGHMGHDDPEFACLLSSLGYC